MRIIRSLSPAALGALLLAAAFIAPMALAGTADDSEISDIKDGTRDARDIRAVWFDGETNETIDATMNLTALDSYTNPQEIPNLPTTEYEVYFSVGDKNFSAACSVPVHGPAGLFIGFDIRSVTYGNSTSNPTETQISTINGVYTVSAHTIRFTIPKVQIGEPKAGTHLSKTWAAVWNKDRGQAERSLEDRAPNAGYGKDYVIRGSSGAEIINIELTAENGTMPVRPGEPARFKVTVLNNGTSQVSLELHNSTPPDKGWTCSISTENLTLSINRTILVTVTIACPRDARNGTTETITILALVHSGNQNSTSKTLLLTAVVDYIPPKQDTSSNPFTAFINWVKAHPKEFYMYIAIVAVIVSGAVGAVAVRRISRRKRQLSAQSPTQT
jgi:hypothetical protein